MTRKAKSRARAGAATGDYELQGDAKDAAISAMWPGTDPRNAQVYDPLTSALVPAGGAWGMVRMKLPPMEHDFHEKVTPGRVFWLEHEGSADARGFLPDGTYKVKVRSPWGDLHVWPYEYTVMRPEFLIECWQAGDMTFHPLGTDERTMNDVMFYAMSRGIARADAMVMALGSLSGPVGWFDCSDGMRAAMRTFESVGGGLTAVNRARRARAQRQKTIGTRKGRKP